MKYKYILWLISGVVIGFAVAHINLNKQNKNTAIEITPTPQATTITYPDLQYYQSLLESQELQITNTQVENLIGNGKQIIFTTIGVGCGSCHYNEIHIYDNKKELFVFYGEDTGLYPISGFGFMISQPVYKNGYGNSTEYQSAVYKWNGKIFVKTETSSNWIDSHQVPG